MKHRRWLAGLAGLVLLLIVLRESREPYLWLYVDDVFRPKPAPTTLPLTQGLAARLYTDPRPHVGKVARLQKGLVLLVDGQPWIEEGFGFGLPLVEVDGQAYLSRAATVERVDAPAGPTLVKHYEMDTVDTPSGLLRRKYEPVPSIGTVTVSYTIGTQAGAPAIDVAVDLSRLEADWSRAYVMNEQGAGRFTRYEELGLVAEGDAFGHWQLTMAPRGCVVAPEDDVRFCVETEENVPRYYGRERYYQFYWIGVYALSWAGIDLEIEAPTPRLTYRIVLERQGGG